ncbi:coiled-coil domain-containing protein 106b [Eucyclogobius newberryi]|uniref:coiled-coil domain-containing protein 106b n=1 Tax=Eucyclogobius newberryi TaxID=166745 RepID=UPI003B5A34D4
MDPRSGREDANPEHYLVPGPSEEAPARRGGGGGGSGGGGLYLDAYEEAPARRGGGGSGGGGLYLDAYEVSFPLDESVERPQAYHINQGPRMVDEGVVQEPSPYSPFILVSNLRAHLYVALEKNAWLLKRIEELEEERNFLRCQLDRFIVNMRAQEDWCTDPQRSAKVQPDSCPSPPSPMTTRSGMTLKRLQGAGARIRHRGAAIPVKQEYHLEEERGEFYTEDEFVEEAEEEEEEEDSSVEQGSKKSRGRASGEPRMKMRRIFRITHGRERQRVKDPDGVLIRYKKILTTYQRVRSMSRAFQVHGVDRNTMASTSPIAELLLIAPEKMAEVGEFEASKEKLLDYARRCYKMMDEETHAKVQTMKKTHKLLPISYRFRN